MNDIRKIQRRNFKLMNNQINALRAANIQVATINSQTRASAKNAILDDLKSGHPRTKLLYVTPEYCTLDHFRKCLRLVHEQRGDVPDCDAV